jgi:hypothetical protein
MQNLLLILQFGNRFGDYSWVVGVLEFMHPGCQRMGCVVGQNGTLRLENGGSRVEFFVDIVNRDAALFFTAA